MVNDRNALEKARLLYNELYPDGQISSVGDTPDAAYYLETLGYLWIGGDKPLTADQIACVEHNVPAGAFS